jgi:hypothetical protein
MWEWWWRSARLSARQFLVGIDPPGIDIYGPVLGVDEYCLLETDLMMSRLYGGAGGYYRNNLFIVGRPLVMAGALAVNAVVNHRRKVAARRNAVLRWHDEQPVNMWVTTHRLICETVGRLDSIWYDTITEFHPDLERWSLTLGFGNDIPPVRFVGPAAPMLCLRTATATLGPRWVQDPRLTPLLAA